MTPGSLSILVADDEPQLLRVLVRVLEKNGYVVLIAADGDEAQRVFGAAPDDIDIVVLDATIDPNGAEVVLDEVVKRRPGIALIVTSGEGLSSTMNAKLLDNGGIFLRKPFPPKVFLRTIEESLGPDAG